MIQYRRFVGFACGLLFAAGTFAQSPVTVEEQANIQGAIERPCEPLPPTERGGMGGSKGVPLSRYLRPDGTLALPPEGIQGSIDPAGFHLSNVPGDAPRFSSAPETGAPEVPGDECWDNRFQPRGMSGYVHALSWDGVNLYAGGDFTTVGGVVVNRIAKWDGTNWSALGTGMNNSVWALAWDGTNLYAGGYFTTAGGFLRQPHRNVGRDGLERSGVRRE